MLKSVCIVFGIVATALANTEKAIFLGPKTVNIPSTHPSLEDLRIPTLTPSNWALRTHLEAQFPTDAAKFGKSTWLVLDKLTEGQRYEARLCWAATVRVFGICAQFYTLIDKQQPTSFQLNTYELDSVFSTSELITDLSQYSWSRQSIDDDNISSPPQAIPAVDREASILLLQILAAADYYTTNQTLMTKVPPVYVDIILDPFVFNVLPRSLVPTVGYIVVVALFSWFLARYVSAWIRQLALAPDHMKKDL